MLLKQKRRWDNAQNKIKEKKEELIEIRKNVNEAIEEKNKKIKEQKKEITIKNHLKYLIEKRQVQDYNILKLLENIKQTDMRREIEDERMMLESRRRMVEEQEKMNEELKKCDSEQEKRKIRRPFVERINENFKNSIEFSRRIRENQIRMGNLNVAINNYIERIEENEQINNIEVDDEEENLSQITYDLDLLDGDEESETLG